MPFLNLLIGVQQRHESKLGSYTSELMLSAPTEASLSSGLIAALDSYDYPGVDTFPDDKGESCKALLKSLIKERKAKDQRKYPNVSPKKMSPMKMKEPVSLDTTAYESFGGSSSTVPGFDFANFSLFTPSSTLKIPRRISVIELESKPKSSIVINVEEKPPTPGWKERKYWNKFASGHLHNFGVVHLRTAEALMQLGYSHMRCNEYKEALTVFKCVTRIFRRVNGHYDLSVAMALNKVGLATCQLGKLERNLRNVMDALNQALSIRYDIMGPTHVDTIDTLNNIAAVHLHLQEFQKARQAYFEVWSLQEAIFGPTHPIVAVTAHCLGGAHATWRSGGGVQVLSECLENLQRLAVEQR